MNTNRTSAAAYLTFLAGRALPDFDMPVLTNKKQPGHRSAAAQAKSRRKPNVQRRKR